MRNGLSRHLLLASLALAAVARAGGAEPTPAAVRSALERAIGGERESLRLLVECRRDDRLPSLVVHGRGVGIWDGARQFALEPEAVGALLVALRDGGFAELAPVFGGRGTADGTPAPDAAALKVLCRIRLVLAALSKQVVQLDEGEPSEALARLAARLYEIAAPAAASGIEAASLADGLAKLASGELAPETLSATLHRKPELGSPPARPAFLLHLDGRRARTQPFTVGAGYGATHELELGPVELAELAAALAAHDPGGLPANLWAPDYNDLEIRVLDRRVAVQARRFSGMSPATHGAAQAEFDAIAALLARLHERVVRDGAADDAH